MTSSRVAGLDGIDWSRPWLAPLREHGEALSRRARTHGLVDALNRDTRIADVALQVGCLRFVPQSDLPDGEPYEAFIARTACVPTRDNVHDFFNGLIWLAHPATKRRLNELQAGQIMRGPIDGRRGAVRDALTLFDENAALWQAPAVLVDALRQRDWHALFVTRRAAWVDARLTLFGHALIEKLTHPRKPITAHVWVLPLGKDDPRGQVFGTAAQALLLDALTPERLVLRQHLPLPVLGVPGWWPANERPDFYDDAVVFRPARPHALRVISAPLDQRNAQADAGLLEVVVDQALAVAAEQLHLPLQVAGDREGPVQFG